MKLIELIVNCIKETIRNDDSSFNVTNVLDRAKDTDPMYSTELNNVLLSVNKAISRLTTKEKLKYRKVQLETKFAQYEYELDELELPSHIGLKSVKQAYYIVDGVVIPVEYSIINQTLILKNPMTRKLNIVYSPYIKQFTEIDMYKDYDMQIELETLGIDDEIAPMINYFAKSELYEDRDADRSKRYLNFFESFINDVKNVQVIPTQQRVEAAYGIDCYDNYGGLPFPYGVVINKGE